MFAFKSYKINFSSPNATGVFRRGETLSGELRFVLGREIEIKQITVTLKGKASVLWETKRGKASIDHKGKVVYYRDREVLLRARSTLKPGVHVYPFLCKLPRGWATAHMVTRKLRKNPIYADEEFDQGSKAPIQIHPPAPEIVLPVTPSTTLQSPPKSPSIYHNLEPRSSSSPNVTPFLHSSTVLSFGEDFPGMGEMSAARPFMEFSPEVPDTRDTARQALKDVALQKLVAMVTELTSEVKELRKEVQEFRQYCRCCQPVRGEGQLVQGNLLELPLRTMEDFDLAENILQTPEACNALITRLKVVGGTCLDSKVRRVMSLILTNELASGFNWAGKRRKDLDEHAKQKRAFRDTKVRKCINFPSTFKSGHGKISYSVIFEIHRSVNQSKTLESEFQFERLVNVNVPALLMPQSATKSTSLYRFCCTVTGDLSMDVLVDKKGYVPGETITITIEGGNGTSSTIVPTAELERKVIYYEDGMINQKSKSKQVKYVVGEHVKPNTSEFKGEIKLCIPKDTYITLQDCKVLVVEYSLEVGLSANAATALTAVFPIVIGNSPPMPEEPETN